MREALHPGPTTDPVAELCEIDLHRTVNTARRADTKVARFLSHRTAQVDRHPIHSNELAATATRASALTGKYLHLIIWRDITRLTSLTSGQCNAFRLRQLDDPCTLCWHIPHLSYKDRRE